MTESCFADALAPRDLAYYALRVRGLDGGFVRVIEVFWVEGSTLTFVAYAHEDGDEYVAALDWRHATFEARRA